MRAAAAVAAALLLSVVLPATATGYSRRGGYIVDGAPRGGNITYAAGLPLVNYNGSWHRNPVTISQYGLWMHKRWRQTHARSDVHGALRAARWLVSHQRLGVWRYDFPYKSAGMTETLQPGWFSAMAQGQAMSLLVRAYYITGHTTFLQVARRALRPFSVPVPQGVLGNLDGPWYEEYPSAHPTHVLNGFMFSLLGLYDLAPYSTKAARLYREGRGSLLRALPRFDGPGISRYDLAVLASKTYNHVRVVELRVLDSINPTPVLRFWAARFASYDK